MTNTHNFVIMDISPAAYEEIKAKLLAANYHQDIIANRTGGEMLDMHGIALCIQPEPEPTTHSSADNRKRIRAGKPKMDGE